MAVYPLAPSLPLPPPLRSLSLPLHAAECSDEGAARCSGDGSPSLPLLAAECSDEGAFRTHLCCANVGLLTTHLQTAMAV